MKRALPIVCVVLLVGCTADLTGNMDAPPENEETFMKDDKEWMRHESDDLGLRFAYRIDPDGYIVDERESEEEGKLGTIVLMRQDDMLELEAATEPREGPPTVTIEVYENPIGEGAESWIMHHPQSNYQEGTPLEDVRMDGNDGAGVRYAMDGLYPGEVTAIDSGGKMYIFTVTYLSETDGYHKAGREFLETVDLFRTED